jgi:hypothetical protein
VDYAVLPEVQVISTGFYDYTQIIDGCSNDSVVFPLTSSLLLGYQPCLSRYSLGVSIACESRSFLARLIYQHAAKVKV